MSKPGFIKGALIKGSEQVEGKDRMTSVNRAPYHIDQDIRNPCVLVWG